MIFFLFQFSAVQNERTPKVHGSNVSQQSSASAANYHPTIYSGLNGTRHTDLIFPFPMHLPTANLSFPLDPYYIPNSHYYPHLTDSFNFKLTETYKQNLISPTPTYNMEIGKILSNNLFSRVILNESKTEDTKPPPAKKSPKDDEVSSSEETNNNSIFPLQLAPNNKVDILFESATKLLFLAVKWAKSIPSFNQFSVDDQKYLLEDSWGELFVIAAAQWGLSIEEEVTEIYPHLKSLKNVIRNFSSLKVDQFEAACLKALILFKSDLNQNSIAFQQISLLQNQTLCLLVEKSGGLRLGHLLLNLPDIKVAGNSQKLQVTDRFNGK